MLSSDELVAAVKLTDLDFSEVSARRREAGQGPNSDSTHVDDSELSVTATRRPDRIEVLCSVDHTAADATYRVAVRGVFQASEPFEVADDVMTGFVQQVGVMALYPFLREAVRDLSAKIGAQPALMDLIRPGQIHLGLQGKAGSN
ncbi:MAG: hypothetical protein ABI239_02495 [Aquihabitans sp.]